MKKILEILTSKNIIIATSFGIVVVILWNTYDFSKKFKVNERAKMELFAEAYNRFNSASLDEDLTLISKIISSNHDIPMIVTDKDGKPIMNKNLDVTKVLDTLYLKERLLLMQKDNDPIAIDYSDGKQYVIYYGDSDLLTKLKYYPLTLLIILILFSGIIYLVFKSSRIADQNRLWTGMAKETAHQIGTPLSSLLGWVELMKLENKAPEIVPEIEKDIVRLNVIADRFSKIGSLPTLSVLDIEDVLDKTIAYFKARSSKNISFFYEKPGIKISANINEQLFSWVLENLIKNAIDAMSGRGELRITLTKESRYIKLLISDSGKGMTRKQFKKIFTPGYTTKKRGWGLGLSLSKRIIEDYHMGKIFVRKSELNKGTVFEIHLPHI